MVVTDLADTSKRVDALGKLAISYGVGMVIGPVVGGVIGTYVGLRAAALIACFGSVFSAVLCHALLPRCAKKPSSSRPAADNSLFNVYRLGQIIKKKKAITLLTVRFVTGVPIGIFQSMFAVVAMEMYGLNAAQNGYLMSYIGILSMLVQGLCMGELNKHFNEIQLIKGGVLILMWAYLFLMLVDTVWQLCLVFIPLVFGLSVLTVVISAALTHSVPDEDTGAILGVNMAVNSLIRTLSPTLGGFLLQTFGFGSFGFLGFVQSIATSVYLSFRFQDKGTVIQKDSVTQTDVNHCLGKAATAP